MLTGVIVALALILATGFIYLYGNSAQRRRGQDSFALPQRADETALDKALAPLEGDHPGETGLHIMPGNMEAFAARWQSLRLAGRTDS